MSDIELKKIADNSDMIINGYSFTKKDHIISILNLNHPDRAMIISPDGKMLETNMEPIEQTLVLNYWQKNSSLVEDNDA